MRGVKYYIRRIGHTEYFGPLLPIQMGDRSMVIADWVAIEARGQRHGQLMKEEGWVPLAAILSEQEAKQLAAQPATPTELLRLRSRYNSIRTSMQIATWVSLTALVVCSLVKLAEVGERRNTVLIMDSLKDLFVWGGLILGVCFVVTLLADLADLGWDKREKQGKEER